MGILANSFRVYWYTTTPLADPDPSKENRTYCGRAFSQQLITKHMRTQQKLETLVSNRTDSSISVDEKVEAAGRGPFLFPTYLGRSKGLCSQGKDRRKTLNHPENSLDHVATVNR